MEQNHGNGRQSKIILGAEKSRSSMESITSIPFRQSMKSTGALLKHSPGRSSRTLTTSLEYCVPVRSTDVDTTRSWCVDDVGGTDIDCVRQFRGLVVSDDDVTFEEFTATLSRRSVFTARAGDRKLHPSPSVAEMGAVEL